MSINMEKLLSEQIAQTVTGNDLILFRQFQRLDDTAVTAAQAKEFFFSTVLETKLNGIQAGAQVNAVTTVAGRTGAIVLAKADVGLGNVDNTADIAKPISTATQTALNLKANLASPTFTGTVTLPAGQVVNGVTLTTGGGTTNFLRADGTYAAPPTDTQNVFIQATAPSASGAYLWINTSGGNLQFLVEDGV